ncbi:hypothetical protein FPCIR_5489 [Fusarium pseudocircinatum]|uniref:Uncharacterized protein n=1 Tax=Fusarium pseudocircinatum TaxID=56676 RepID=A0A8H5PA56_9HYPO|nr:hypothetical protein FPCIR_5489 [Fusarium pseudocircinatum]
MIEISATDPFFRLPSNVREKILTNMDCYEWYFIEDNPDSGFASSLALNIELSVRDGIKAAAEEEELRKWGEEQSRKWEQSTKADVAGGMLDHGSDQATDEEGEEEWVLCLASPVMRTERRTSTLLLTSEFLVQIFGGTHDGAFIEAHMYSLLSKDGLSDENFALWKKRQLLHPLFSNRQDIVFRMNALSHRLMDCFNFGPGIVPWFIKKLPYSVFAHYAAGAFERNGERFPASLHDARDVKKGQVFFFLLAVNMAGSPYICEHEASRRQYCEQNMGLERQEIVVCKPNFPISTKEGDNARSFMQDLMCDTYRVEIYGSRIKSLLDRRRLRNDEVY